jgi:DNA-binding NarL/FixJ family response regulator
MVLVREGLASLCEASARFQVVAQCSEGEQALALIVKLNPDLAILDCDLGKLYVLEVVRKARQLGATTKIIILSGRSDRKSALEALRGGASGFLLKSCLVREMLDALRQVLDGGVYVAPQVGLEKIWSTERRKGSIDPFESLSSREHQVFSLLVDGLRAKEIAARLDLSPKTVDTYRASLMRKLDIHDIAGLVKFAITRKLTSIS